MTTWYRQLLSTIYGVGVMLIALWALEQGSGPTVVLGVVGMSMLTLMMIFGIEVDSVKFGELARVEFSNTDGSNSEDDGDE
jgi:hypothetical protein